MLFAGTQRTRAFTITEVILVVLLTSMVILAVITAWVFTYKTWTGESEKTHLRIDLMEAVETIKSDVRLSSLAQGDAVFYPQNAGAYTAISFPVADEDGATGLFNVAEEGIQWDRTIIYHIFTDGEGNRILRRTVYDPRDNTMTEEERYNQLESVVTNGTGGGGSTTDNSFLENLDTFEISPLSSIIDFYDASSEAVQVGKVVFGWAKLDSGDHVIKFEILEANEDSSGNDIGLDNITIEPAGGKREAEFYQDPSNLDVSGGSMNYPFDTDFYNKGYAEFQPSGVGSYVEFTDYYDLWRESVFDGASLDNVEIPDLVTRVDLKVPDPGEEGVFAWSAGDEVGQQASNGFLLGDAVSGVTPPVAFRTVITSGNIPWDTDLVRVRLMASSADPIIIDKAYITKRDGSGTPDGLDNLDPTGVSDPVWSDYHYHQQLFFKDGSNITEGITISSDTEVWSEWTAFPLQEDSDYLVSLYISDTSSTTCKYWPGTGTIKTYYIRRSPDNASVYAASPAWFNLTGGNTHSLQDNDKIMVGTDLSGVNLENMCGMPAWSGSFTYYVINSQTDNTKFQVSNTEGGAAVPFAEGVYQFIQLSSSNNIYVVADLDSWDVSGTVTSQIFDTTLSNPAYGEVKWEEGGTSNTAVAVKVRSSDDGAMYGATDWDSLTGYTTSGSSVSAGTGRYAQFQAELSTEPYWEEGGSQKTYKTYLAEQTALSSWQFPTSLSGVPYVTVVDDVWIDDIEIDWPGEERICEVSGYVAKRNDYGRAEVTIDGSALLKVLSIDVSVSKEVRDSVLTAEKTIEVEPRNTGK